MFSWTHCLIKHKILVSGIVHGWQALMTYKPYKTDDCVLFCRFYYFSLPIASQIYLTKGTRQENMNRPAHFHCPGKVKQRIGYLFHPYTSWSYAFICDKSIPCLITRAIKKRQIHDLWSQEVSMFSEKNTPTSRNVLKAKYKQVQMSKHKLNLFGAAPAVSNQISLFLMEMCINLREKSCQVVEINREFRSLLDFQKRIHLTIKFISDIYSLYVFRFFNLGTSENKWNMCHFNGINFLLLSFLLSSGIPTKQQNNSKFIA